MKSILDPDFEYTPNMATDTRAMSERVWRELRPVLLGIPLKTTSHSHEACASQQMLL